jgi:hypothetical protein
MQIKRGDLLFASSVVLDYTPTSFCPPLFFCFRVFVIYMLCPVLTFPIKAALLKKKLMTQWIIWILKYPIPLLCSLYETVIYSLLQYLHNPRFNICLFVLFIAIFICFVSFWLVSFRFGWFRFVSAWFRFVSIGFVSFRLVPFRFVLVSFRTL